MTRSTTTARPDAEGRCLIDPQESALGELVRTRRGDLTGYAYLLCGSLAEAEDLVQDALVSALVRRRSDVTSLEAYVRTTMRNAYVDGFRRRRRWAALRHLYVTGEEGRSGDARAADQVMARVDLQQAMSALSPRQRACVVLRYYDDLTVPQVAEELGLSAGTVKRHLSDAARRLAPLVDDVAAATRERATRERGER